MKWLVRVGWAVGGVLALWALTWLGVPPLLKWQAEKQLSSRLGRTVTVEGVRFRPWALEVQVERLSIAAAEAQAPPLLSIERVRANATLSSLLRLAPVLEAIDIEAPHVRIAHLGEGRYDVDDIMARLAPAPGSKPEPDGAPARFAVYNLQMSGGEVDFEDRPVGVRHEIKALALSLPFISSLPSDVDIKVEPRLAFTINGTPFDTGAQATPFARDRATSMTLRIGRFDLKPYLPYVPAASPLQLRAATVSADLSVELAAPAGQVPTVKIRGTASVDDVDVADRAGQGLAAWRRLALTLRDVQPLARSAELDSVELDGARLQVRRDRQGRLEILQLAGASGAAADAAAPSKGWTVALDAIEIGDASVDWHDAATQPAARLGLDRIGFSAKSVRWPSADPWPIRMQATLQGSAATFTLEGDANDRRARLKAQVDKLGFAPFAPYLAEVLRPRLEGQLRATATIDWAVDAPPPGVTLMLEQAVLDDLRLQAEAARSEPLASLQRLDVGPVKVDLAARKVEAASLRLVRPAIDLQRARSGEFNVAQWGVETPAAGGAAAPAAPPWRLRVADLVLDAARVGWTDETTARPVRVLVDELELGAKGFEWAGDEAVPPAEVQLAARVLRAAAPGRRAAAVVPGRIAWRGQVGASPLLARGTLKVEKLGLETFRPYIANHVNVDILRAMADFRGDLIVQQSAPGAKGATAGLTAAVKGDAVLADLRVVSRVPAGTVATPEELLAWQALSLKGLDLAIAPHAKPRLSIGQAQLSDFYSRLVITEQGRFNLQDVTADAAPAGPPAAAAAASAASSPGAPASASALEELPVVIAVGGVTLSNGKVDFSDRFVRPNYSAALSELNGKLGAFRSDSREMATLELHGKAAGTAQLDVSGSLNPTARPLALDIRAKATDLELAPLSPYAGKYAGYAIERGKLSMDVAYKIDPDGRLDARNQIILNQLTFGEKIDSPDATKLPVLFAVSLLKDRNGNIDLDVPISGSINDPQFSVFGLVLKVIGNLIVKAITAPFSLFAGGAGEDLSAIEFVPGTATPAPAAAASIDKVSRALLDRPALKLTVTGTADAAGERAAMQQQALEQRLRAEWRRETGVDDPKAELPPDDRLRLLRSVYRRTDIPDKPRNVLGIQKDLPAAEMESMLLARTAVSDETARELALQRGVAVRDALIAKGLPSERLFLAAPKLRSPTDTELGWSPHASLALSLN